MKGVTGRRRGDRYGGNEPTAAPVIQGAVLSPSEPQEPSTMAIFRTLTAALRRRSDSRTAKDIVESGTAHRSDSGSTPTVTTPLSTQGVRPYGFGY